MSEYMKRILKINDFDIHILFRFEEQNVSHRFLVVDNEKTFRCARCAFLPRVLCLTQRPSTSNSRKPDQEITLEGSLRHLYPVIL